MNMANPALLFLSLRVVTLAEAEKLADEHQPSNLQAMAQTEAARARGDEALAPLLPQITGAASYGKTTMNIQPSPTVTRINPNTMQSLSTSDFTKTADQFSLSLQGRQLLYDFQLSIDKHRAALRSLASQADSERSTRLLTLQTVRTQYFTARADKALVAVARDTVTNLQRHLDQIAGFVKVGNRPEIDLAQARTDLANGQVSLITAENNYEVAKAQLNIAMGVLASTDYDVADDELAAVAGEDGPTAALMEEALKARPDVTSLRAAIAAQELTISSTRGSNFPSFSAFTNFTGGGSTNVTDLGYNLIAGLRADYSFSGGLAIAQVREQKALLAFNLAQLESLKLQVQLDVDQGRLAVRAAKAQVVAATEALDNARERLRLAEGRYAAGVGNVIELGDAQVAYTSAAAARIQFQNNLGSARAQLLRALGRR